MEDDTADTFQWTTWLGSMERIPFRTSGCGLVATVNQLWGLPQILGVPSVSILSFLESLRKPWENGSGFLERTMVEKNGWNKNQP